MTTTHLRSLLGLALLSSVSGVAACGGSSTVDAPDEARSALAYNTAPQISDSDYKTLVSDNNGFATDLYQAVRGDGTKNLFYSPTSISTALAMTFAGANGDTATQIADVLHFSLPPASLHAGMDRLALDLAARGKSAISGKLPFALHEMDALWVKKNYAVEAPFLDTLQTNYDAGVYQLDFAADPEAARGQINAWVAQETDGHINDLIAKGLIIPDTRLVLTNAIFFEAAWATPFDPTITAPAPFTTAAGAAVTVDTMHASGSYAYAEGSDFQAIELGYDGGDIAMDVLLPTGKDAPALAAFEASLTNDRLTSILGSLQDGQVELSLPKFTFSAALSLADTLKAMGMPIPFIDGSADFRKIETLEPLHIGAVEHKGFITVDELGTTAAAATAVTLNAGGAPDGHTVVADHPYIIVVRDLPTGTILFLGRVSDPTAM